MKLYTPVVCGERPVMNAAAGQRQRGWLLLRARRGQWRRTLAHQPGTPSTHVSDVVRRRRETVRDGCGR